MSAEFMFMDDNACPHRANIVDERLQSEYITRMDWPAYSPDLNPIEHVWDMLGRRTAARCNRRNRWRPLPCKFKASLPLIFRSTVFDSSGVEKGLNCSCKMHVWLSGPTKMPTTFDVRRSDVTPSIASHLSTGTSEGIVLDEWCNIPQDQIDNLILSMPRRCKACVASSGRHTPY
ncbi:DDE_3 domain-containing protein [Trichonephila clavipes]|nr:DDE_3 domain-containing protein [Trichonephila clavipes]